MPYFYNDSSQYISDLLNKANYEEVKNNRIYTRLKTLTPLNNWKGSAFITQIDRLIIINGRVIYPSPGYGAPIFDVGSGWTPKNETFFSAVINSYGLGAQLIISTAGMVEIWASPATPATGTILPISGFWISKS